MTISGPLKLTLSYDSFVLDHVLVSTLAEKRAAYNSLVGPEFNTRLSYGWARTDGWGAWVLRWYNMSKQIDELEKRWRRR